MFDVESYDHEATSARLLGRDMATLLDKAANVRILEVLLPEADAQGALILASQSGRNLQQARVAIEALCEGLADRL